MSESEKLTLYDITAKSPCKCFSGNVWKTRLALNYKGIPYKTEWVPYIHLQEKVKSFGVPANPPGSWSEYSLPTVHFPDGSYVMDSAAIALELERRYPTPSLRLNLSLEKRVSDAMGQVFISLVPYLLTTAASVVAPEDLEWFKEDRAWRFGMSVEAFETERDLSPAVDAARPGLEQAAKLLNEHKVDEGPFILGSVPCYADFLVVANLAMLSRVWDEFFESFLKAAPREVRGLWKASGEWVRRMD